MIIGAGRKNQPFCVCSSFHYHFLTILHIDALGGWGVEAAALEVVGGTVGRLRSQSLGNADNRFIENYLILKEIAVLWVMTCTVIGSPVKLARVKY